MSLDPPRCEHSRTLCSTVLSSREFKVNGLYTWEIYGELWGYLSKQYLLARVPDRLPNLVGLLLMCILLLSNPKLDRNPKTKFAFFCNQNISKSGIPTNEGFIMCDCNFWPFQSEPSIHQLVPNHHSISHFFKYQCG